MVRLLKTLKIILFLTTMAVICGFSFFFTAATGSYLGYVEGNWKENLVFTPKSVDEPEDIYEVDKIIYAFNVHPIVTIVFILSSLILIVGIIYCITKLIRRYK